MYAEIWDSFSSFAWDCDVSIVIFFLAGWWISIEHTYMGLVLDCYSHVLFVFFLCIVRRITISMGNKTPNESEVKSEFVSEKSYCE